MGLTFDDLYGEAKTRILAETKISNLSAGTIARALLQAHASLTSELYSYIDTRMLNAYVSTATGTFLDELGKLVTATRASAHFAEGQVRFYIDPELGLSFQNLMDLVNQRSGGSDTQILVPAGTTVQADNRTYVTLADAILQEGQSEVTVGVISTLAGTFGNVQQGSINTVQWPDPTLAILQGVLLVTNDEAIETGQDAMSDADFRFFITNSIPASAMANTTAIRLACLSVPGVSDISIEKYSYGIGTFAVYVTSGSPIVTAGTLLAVQAAINNAKAEGIRGVAVSPTLLGIQMNVALVFLPTTKAEDKTTINRAVQNAVISYINNLKAGEELVVNEVIDKVMNVSSQIHDAQIINMAIGDYDIALGIITNVDTTISISNQKPAVREKYVSNTSLITVCHV